MIKTKINWSGYLRLLVTSSNMCNFKCNYCHKEGFVPELKQTDLLLPNDYKIIAKAAQKVGIRKVSITGSGEPLQRGDIIDVIKAVSNYFEDISMTTNGIHLTKLAKPLKKAGLSRINISLDTLDSKLFQQITGSNTHYLDRIIRGIDKAKIVGLAPIKINSVFIGNNFYLKSLSKLFDFARKNQFLLRLIELLHGIYKSDNNDVSRYTYEQIILYLEKQYGAKRLPTEIEKFKRSFYRLPNGQIIEVCGILCSELLQGNPGFCHECLKFYGLRVTPDGKLKTCLLPESDLFDFSSSLKKKSCIGIQKVLQEAVVNRKQNSIKYKSIR